MNLLLDEVDGDGPFRPAAGHARVGTAAAELAAPRPAHNYPPLLHGHSRPGAAPPRPIRRAAELIETHAGEPLTVEDVAVATGMSVRALQEGFRRYLELHSHGLICARSGSGAPGEELSAADPTCTTVTEIAVRCGFLHAGRFSARYHKRFGESPFVTLRR